jgi:hypothetical protein
MGVRVFGSDLESLEVVPRRRGVSWMCFEARL